MSGKEKLLSVREVSRLTGVSVRTLRYYDEIGLLTPTQVTEAGYRLYDREALRRLQIILLYRELEFPLREISMMMPGGGFSVDEAIERQIVLLKKKRVHLDNLITLAEGIKSLGVENMDFSEFDMKKIDEYEEEAKATWGGTQAYREYERKSADRSAEENLALGVGLMNIFAEMGELRHLAPSDDRVQEKVAAIQRYITEHYYTCTDGIFQALGTMYGAEGGMQRSIDKAGGEGTAEFTSRAIKIYISRRKRD